MFFRSILAVWRKHRSAALHRRAYRKAMRKLVRSMKEGV